MLELDKSVETIDNLRSLLAHPAWTDFFVPTLISTRDAAIQQLLDPSEVRKQDYPDNYLRAQVEILNALMNVGPRAISEYDADQLLIKQANEWEEGTEIRADLGRVGPL